MNGFLLKEISKLFAKSFVQEQNELTYEASKLVLKIPKYNFYICQKAVDSNVKIIPENENDNIEYKWKIIPEDASRMNSLSTQLNYRIRIGEGVCHYILGVSDSGKILGLSAEVMFLTIENLIKIGNMVDAQCDFITLIQLKNIKKETVFIAQISVHSKNTSVNLPEIRLAIIGSSLVGKSTIISVIVSETLDDGYGSARTGRFRHFHEELSGETSCVSLDLIGFDTCNEVINYSKSESMREIIKLSKRIVVFIDLAGNSKYIRTTLFGISSHVPHYVLLVIDCSSPEPLDEIAITHVEFSFALDIPMIIVMNKVDKATPEYFEYTLAKLKCFFNDVGKVCNLITQLPDDFSVDKTTVPVFKLSCITGEGLDTLIACFSLLKNKTISNQTTNLSEFWKRDCHFGISLAFEGRNIFSINKNYMNESKLIVTGIVLAGRFEVNQAVHLGPIDRDGKFIEVKLESLENYRSTLTGVDAFNSAGISLSIDNSIKLPTQGMILVDKANNTKITNSFVALIEINDHNFKIKSRFCATLHSFNNIRQVVISEVIECKTENNSTYAKVMLKFENRAKYLVYYTHFVLRNPPYRYMRGKVLHLLAD